MESKGQKIRLGKWAYFEGKIVPFKDAKVSVATHTFNYGTGCFGGIRAYWNQKQKQLYVFRPERHFERFLQSCKLLNITLPHDAPALAKIVVELLRKDGYQENVYVRPLAYKATTDLTPRLHNLRDEVTIFTRPYGNYVKLELNAGISSFRRIDDNMIPARGKIVGAYANSAFAHSEAVGNGYDEAIVLSAEGHISEGSAENFFMVRKGKLFTPGVTDNILEGITRETIMIIAREEFGMQVEERSIDRSELYVADEAFFCGTGAQVAAILSVDHRPIGSGKIGPITKKIQDFYFRMVQGEEEKYLELLTPVYGK